MSTVYREAMRVLVCDVDWPESMCSASAGVRVRIDVIVHTLKKILARATSQSSTFPGT